MRGTKWRANWTCWLGGTGTGTGRRLTELQQVEQICSSVVCIGQAASRRWESRLRSLGGTHDGRAMVRLLTICRRGRNGGGNRGLLVARRQLLRLRLLAVEAVTVVVVVAVARFQVDI